MYAHTKCFWSRVCRFSLTVLHNLLQSCDSAPVLGVRNDIKNMNKGDPSAPIYTTIQKKLTFTVFSKSPSRT